MRRVLGGRPGSAPARSRRPGRSGSADGTGSRTAVRSGCPGRRPRPPPPRCGRAPAAGTAFSSALGVRVPRVGEQLGGRRRLDDPAQVHDGDPVADVAHDRHVVGDEQHRQPEPLLQVGEQVEHRRLHRDVERRHRLVGDQHLGLERQRAGDRRRAGAGRRRTGAGCASSALGGRPTRSISSRQRASTWLGGTSLWARSSSPSAWRTVMPRVERRVRVLEDHLDRAPLGAVALRRHRLAVEQHLAGGRLGRGRRCSGPAWTCRSPTRRPGRASRRARSAGRRRRRRGARRRGRRASAPASDVPSGKCISRPAHLEQRAQPPAITGSSCTAVAAARRRGCRRCCASA